MATKTKDKNSIVGNKEKKSKSSTRPSSSSSIENSTTSQNQSSKKQIPNYLKPTFSSQPRSQSFKLPRSSDHHNHNASNNKPNLNRRRSFDKPPKQTQNSLSRQQHKPFVIRNATIPSSKPISSKTTHKPLISSIRRVTTTLKNVAKRTNEKDEINVLETKPELEAKATITNEENMGQLENVQEHDDNDDKVDNNVTENEINEPHHVDSEVKQRHVRDQNVAEIQSDDNKKVKGVIQTVLEGEKENETKDETRDEKEEEEENENMNQDECKNVKEGDEQEINDSRNEGEVVEVKEKEEDKKSEEESKKEQVEGGTSEGVEGKVENEETKVDTPKENEAEEESGVVQGKKESSQVSNDVIEETKNKLLEDRRNKVRALAGAFQTVIDHQTK